jgi:hypothetical protein
MADRDLGDAKSKAELRNADKFARPEQREQLLSTPYGTALIVHSQLRNLPYEFVAPLSAEKPKLVK